MGLLLFIPTLLHSQSAIEIKYADRFNGFKKFGVSMVRLVGNVRFAHEGALMNCDSAYLNQTDNSAIAYGHIRVNQGDSITLTGDRMTYNGVTRMMEIEGNVTLRDPKMTLTTDKIFFDRKVNQAYYLSGGNILQEDKTLRSKVGIYLTGTKEFLFKDSVRIISPDYSVSSDTLVYSTITEGTKMFGPTIIKSGKDSIYCERGTYNPESGRSSFSKNPYMASDGQILKGDSIFFLEKKREGQVFGNVYLWDIKNEILLEGGFAHYTREPESLYVTDEPLLTQLIDGDSLYIHGDQFISKQIDPSREERHMKVFHDVKIYKSDFQAVCDSLYYSDIDSIFFFYGDPVIWNGKTQLTGDEVTLTVRRQKLDSLILIGNAFMIGEIDSVNAHQIKGRDMYGLFTDNQLRKIDVKGNGQTVYYAVDEETGAIEGINRADCSNLIIRLKDQEVSGITFLTKPDATLYPPDKIPVGEKRLKGFRPQFFRRPNEKNDLFK